MQCEDCYKAYHPMCAQKNNNYLTWRKVDDIVVRPPLVLTGLFKSCWILVNCEWWAWLKSDD